MTEPTASPVSPPLILQLCPNDHPPFRDICDVYQAAGASLGCQVMTVFFEAPHGEALPDAHYLNVADVRNSRFLAGALRTLCADFERKPLLVVCHRYRAYRIYLASRLRAHRVVTVAHEFRLLARWSRRLGRALFGRHMIFAGVSPAVQQELVQSGPAALCLPNAINLPPFDAALLPRARARAELDLPEGATAASPFTVAVVGRLIPWKRPELAVAALQALDAGDQVQLVFLGDGPMMATLQQQCVGLPVHLAGFHRDARRLLKAFDALLLVSEAREAFGMVALEAMAAGVPVIAGPAPGPRFVLGDHAIYYQREDAREIAAAIEELRSAQMDGRVQEQVQQARQRVEREFSVAALASKLDALFFHQDSTVRDPRNG